MRQGNSNNKQQQQRMRGRSSSGTGNGGGNTNRKGPNPLSRSYESTGPDVKVRGTALHVAEKYVQLARDAQSSGDRVLAESYLQHAEHYYRIIAAAQAQLQQPITVIRSDIQSDDDDDDDLDTAVDVRAAGYISPDAPQPFIEDPNAQTVAAERLGGERPIQDRPQADRGPRDRYNQDRPSSDRFHNERNSIERNGGERYLQDRPQGDRNRIPNGQSRFRNEGRGDYRQDSNRVDPVRSEAGRFEGRHDGRPDYRGERGLDRGENRNGPRDDRPERGERPVRNERPQYRSDRGDQDRGEPRFERPDRLERPERSEFRPEVRGEPRPEARSEPPVAPVDVRHFEVAAPEPTPSVELPAFITGIQPRVEAVTEPVVPVKRPRGRPRKVPIEVAPTSGANDD